METVSQVYRAYEEWASNKEELILDWFEPTGFHKLSPTKNWPLTSFSSVFLIACGYLLMVAAGTLFMKSKFAPEINTRPLRFIYNPIQVIICSYMSVECIKLFFKHDYSLSQCNPVNVENPVYGSLTWLFFISKMLDFMDTFFIIASKKWRQLSFLHVYHHFTVMIIMWIFTRLLFDGEIYVSIFLNSSVHTIMYMYYFVSMHTSNIWWKRYVTNIQMAQFLLMNAQAVMTLVLPCPGVSTRVSNMYLVYIQTLFWLFFNFSVKNYMTKKKSA